MLSINWLTLEVICLTAMGENPDVKLKNTPTTIATCENTVAILNSQRTKGVPMILFVCKPLVLHFVYNQLFSNSITQNIIFGWQLATARKLVRKY